MKHLTTIYKDNDKTEIKAYALSISVPPGKRAQAVSDALSLALDGKTYNKSKFVCDCIISGVLEPIYQERIRLALDTVDILLVRSDSYKLDKILDNLRMILTGCPTTTATEFTGELSQEYIERYGDE